MEAEDSLPCSKSPPLVPILSQINPIHTIPSYLSKIQTPSIKFYKNQFSGSPVVLV
jgi:hypothetical protein